MCIYLHILDWLEKPKSTIAICVNKCITSILCCVVGFAINIVLVDCVSGEDLRLRSNGITWVATTTLSDFNFIAATCHSVYDNNVILNSLKICSHEMLPGEQDGHESVLQD